MSQATLGSWDRRRFRANVVLHGDAEPGCEDGYVAGQVAIGTAVLDVVKAIDRCVMVTRPQPDGIARDLDQLLELGAHPRAEELVVVDQDDAGPAHDAPRSSTSSTSVPAPGELVMRAEPP